MKNGIQGLLKDLPQKSRTFQECVNPVKESQGYVTSVILTLNLFTVKTCLTCIKQQKLEHCNRKVEFFSHSAIKGGVFVV